MLKKERKTDIAVQSSVKSSSSQPQLLRKVLPHNCKGNCCRNEQENRKKVVGVSYVP